MLDFSRYHNRLFEYLRLKGISNIPGAISCFNPSHIHSGKNTPSMQVGYNNNEQKETFFCYNNTCGAKGDIYDAVELLEGITGKKEQFEFLEKLFGGSYVPAPASGGKTKKRENFIADPDAEKRLKNYLAKLLDAKAEKEIVKFLNLRAASSTLGVCQKYPDDLIPAMVKNFYYWPGLNQVVRDLGADTLFLAGIPLRNPNTGIAWWDHSGVLLKLGKGYKLHYYTEGDCKKFGSKGSSTFPMPGAIDKTKPVILVEGEMDAVSAVAAGIENLFATGGTSGLTGPMIKAHLLEVPEIIFCFDADDPGRKASGLIPYDPTDKKKINLPEIMRNAGYTGIIKIAELPTDKKERDTDALIIAGESGVIFRAIKEAREYIPPEKKADGKASLKWDYLSAKRIQAILKKITKSVIEEKKPSDVQLFISAIVKAVKKSKEIENSLLEWGATNEQIKAKNDVSPYILIEFSWKYGLSKYLQHIIKIELTPASELLKRINRHKPIVDINFDDIKENKNIIQFLGTLGVRTAALVVSDILDGHIIYVEAEKKFYFYNGHTWQREPDMTGVIYNILIAVMIYFYEKIDLKELGLKKADIDEIIVKIENRHFRVEIMSEFSQLEQFDIFKTSILFDGPTVRETLTLIDGVIDFSGEEIIYRKSKKEEYRREVLPYHVNDIKNAIEPKRFKNFMKGNFNDNNTLESLFYYLSLIPTRNTKNKYGGVFIGGTMTGKTTTMDIMQAVFPNMIKSIPAEILVSKGLRQVSGNEATPYIAGLEGKGGGLASETGRNMYLNNALWKLLTGGDTLTARDLYQSPHEFVPTAQIIILTNHLPLFDSHDNATIQRMVIIPFLIEHKRGEKNLINIDEFIEQIKPEYAGIVKLFIEYYIKLKHKHKGLIPLSDECKKYKQLYIEELDTDIDRFIKDCVFFDVANSPYILTKDLYAEYLKYFDLTSEDSGKEALTRQKFTRYFKRDYKEVIQKQKKIDGKPELCFFNVRLKTDEERWTDTESQKKQSTPPPNENPFG